MNPRLTDKQRQVMAFIRKFVEKHGYGPVLREIAEHVGYVSRQSSREVVQKLTEMGYLAEAPHHTIRTIVPADLVEGVTVKVLEFKWYKDKLVEGMAK